MATEQQLVNIKDQLRNQIKELLALPVKEWAVRQNLGDINFSAAIPSIDRTLGLIKMLGGFSLDYVSFNRLSALQAAVTGVVAAFKQIEAFTLDVQNPKQQRDSLVQNLEGQYEGWFEAVYPIIAFAIRGTTDFAALEHDLRQKIAQAEVTSKDLLKQQQAAATQAQETLAAIQTAAAEAGVSQQAIYFAQEANEHKRAALWWIIATAIMGLATVGWGAIAVWAIPLTHDATYEEIFAHVLGKLIILSGIYYGLVWCARNYSATRHNYVVNKHRQNSLSTFETFVKAAGADQDTKNAVLLQTTTSIFTSQPSGYSGKEPEPVQPSKIIEILRSVTAKPSAQE